MDRLEHPQPIFPPLFAGLAVVTTLDCNRIAAETSRVLLTPLCPLVGSSCKAYSTRAIIASGMTARRWRGNHVMYRVTQQEVLRPMASEFGSAIGA